MYANAYVSESTWTRELYVASAVLCSTFSTFVIAEPSEGTVNVWIWPSSPAPVYANAYVSESTWTRELYVALLVSCSYFTILLAVTVPSADMVCVEILPMSVLLAYATK